MRRDIGELSKDFGVLFDRPLFGGMEAPDFCTLVTALVLDGSIVGVRSRLFFLRSTRLVSHYLAISRTS
jgi:hypothetical protein